MIVLLCWILVWVIGIQGTEVQECISQCLPSPTVSPSSSPVTSLPSVSPSESPTITEPTLAPTMSPQIGKEVVCCVYGRNEIRGVYANGVPLEGLEDYVNTALRHEISVRFRATAFRSIAVEIGRISEVTPVIMQLRCHSEDLSWAFVMDPSRCKVKQSPFRGELENAWYLGAVEGETYNRYDSGMYLNQILSDVCGYPVPLTTRVSPVNDPGLGYVHGFVCE